MIAIAHTGTIRNLHEIPVTRGVRSFLRATEPTGPARRRDTSWPSGDQLVLRLESSGWHRKMLAPTMTQPKRPKTEVLPSRIIDIRMHNWGMYQ